jgi:hypothetical protein
VTAPVKYAIDVRPRHAILGESIVAHLSCKAISHAPSAFTFGHRSLVIELMRKGLPEPDLTFPNRHAVNDAGKLVRMAAAGGVEELQAGDKRTRSFDLLTLSPDLVLAPGTLSATYRIEEADPMVRPTPVAVEIASGPAAVPRLIARLDSDSAETRARAAKLLSAMTANDFGYRAGASLNDRREASQRWLAWWQETGSRLPWDFETSGATLGSQPQPAPASRLSLHLGGIAYPKRPR